MPSPFAFMGLYILLLGVAALLEQPIARSLDAFQLDAFLRTGGVALAIVALLILRGPALPGWAPSLASVGIGLISGAGSLCYCVALNRLPADLAACLANGYLVVTVVLGIVVLHEPLTIFTLGGLVLTIGGAVVLSLRSHRAARHEVPAGGSRFALVASQSPTLLPLSPPSASSSSSASSTRLIGVAWVAGYAVLVGIGAFLEKLALRHVAPLQLNALAAVGMLIVGLIAVAPRIVRRAGHHPHAEVSGSRRAWLPAIGIGLMIGAGSVFYYLALAHLPVSIAAALANTYVLVTVVLAVPLLHQHMTWRKGAGVLVMLAGVVLLTMHVPL